MLSPIAATSSLAYPGGSLVTQARTTAGTSSLLLLLLLLLLPSLPLPDCPSWYLYTST
jgi:hypothetical protein